MSRMWYNFNKPTPLGRRKGVLVPIDGLTKEQREDHEWNSRIDHIARGLGYISYSDLPKMSMDDFKARVPLDVDDNNSEKSKETTSTKTLSNLDTSSKSRWKTPPTWKKYHHNEDDDDDKSFQSLFFLAKLGPMYKGLGLWQEGVWVWFGGIWVIKVLFK